MMKVSKFISHVLKKRIHIHVKRTNKTGNLMTINNNWRFLDVGLSMCLQILPRLPR